MDKLHTWFLVRSIAVRSGPLSVLFSLGTRDSQQVLNAIVIVKGGSARELPKESFLQLLGSRDPQALYRMWSL